MPRLSRSTPEPCQTPLERGTSTRCLEQRTYPPTIAVNVMTEQVGSASGMDLRSHTVGGVECCPQRSNRGDVSRAAASVRPAVPGVPLWGRPQMSCASGFPVASRRGKLRRRVETSGHCRAPRTPAAPQVEVRAWAQLTTSPAPASANSARKTLRWHRSPGSDTPGSGPTRWSARGRRHQGGRCLLLGLVDVSAAHHRIRSLEPNLARTAVVPRLFPHRSLPEPRPTWLAPTGVADDGPAAQEKSSMMYFQ